jgi:uncharacterized protein (DUF302 family)
VTSRKDDQRSQSGLERVKSPRGFAETVAKFESLLAATGLTIFARVDFTGDAERVGFKMPPTVLFLFGNPKAGTPVMLAYPDAAIDLPLKILISQDEEGAVWLSYNAPEYVASRHGIPENYAANLAGIRPLVKAAASQ